MEKMTIKAYKEMMLLECGMKLTTAEAKLRMSIEEEHEAEAIAGGKYDVDPELLREAQCKAWIQMPFQVRKGYITYHPSTDATSTASILVGGFNTRDEASDYVRAQYAGFSFDESNEEWFTILPEAPRTLPVAVSLEECPF